MCSLEDLATQKKPTEIWQDNASCIMIMSMSRYLRDLVRDGHVKRVKCAGTQNVSDALTKSLARPAFAKHREYMWGTQGIYVCLFQLSLVLSILRLPL